MVETDTYTMGIFGVPGTFPTQEVQAKILRDLNKRWSRSKINDMYYAYKEAVIEKGLAPYPGRAGEVTPYIVQRTGYDINDVRIFLVTILRMSQETEPGVYRLDQKFINPELQKETVVGKVEAAFKKGGLVPKTLTTAKWLGILAAAGVGLYLARPLLARIRK